MRVLWTTSGNVAIVKIALYIQITHTYYIIYMYVYIDCKSIVTRMVFSARMSTTWKLKRKLWSLMDRLYNIHREFYNARSISQSVTHTQSKHYSNDMRNALNIFKKYIIIHITHYLYNIHIKA